MKSEAMARIPPITQPPSETRWMRAITFRDSASLSRTSSTIVSPRSEAIIASVSVER